MTLMNVALGTALVASIASNVALYGQLSRAKAQVPYFNSERPYIDKAIELFAAEGGSMDNRFAVAMPAPNPKGTDELLTCVSLNLRRGMLGWMPVYCFDRQGKLQRKFRV